MNTPKTYKEAGVNIEKGDRFASFIAGINSPAVSKSLGGFAGGLEIDLTKYKNPVMMSCTDGVGTKLLVAQHLGIFDTLGIDLVAMSVNDLIVCGAEPLSFLDYIACGRIAEPLMEALVQGIVKGCEEAECQLSGGETAEMPDLYKDGDFDLAGFCVGIADKTSILPRKDQMQPGDLIFGLPSVGIHSNGLSLARKIINNPQDPWFKELLTPTKIYVKEMKSLLKSSLIKGAAHITGGGLKANFERILPPNLEPEFAWNWTIPDIFTEIETRGKIKRSEMEKVFNMGIGIAMAVPASGETELHKTAADAGIPLQTIGKIVSKQEK